MLAPLPESTQALAPSLHATALSARDAGPEAGLWIAPIAAATVGLGNMPAITLDDYLTLVDDAYSGSIPAERIATWAGELSG